MTSQQDELTSSDGSYNNGDDRNDNNNIDVAINAATPTADLGSMLESIVRVTLAGLGGSIVGLSQEKRLESMRVVAGAAATAAARRKRSPTSQILNLPLTWAISCMAFCAIIETSRQTSPSTMIWNNFLEPSSADNIQETASENNMVVAPLTNIRKPLTTISDYTIGGAIGGIAGTFGRRTQLQKRLPSAMLRGSQRFFGIVPGIALGLAAGVLQATTDFGLEYTENLARENSSSPSE